MSLVFYLKVFLLRLAQRLNAWIDRTFVSPRPPRPAFSVSIPTRRALHTGRITLYFYTPAGYQRPRASSQQQSAATPQHPLVVNFHGGGFTVGHATDDARLAGALTSTLAAAAAGAAAGPRAGAESGPAAVFVSVGYRKGPEHAAPTAALDAADAVDWLWEHASEYGLDRDRTVTAGSSAGGNLALVVPLVLCDGAEGAEGAEGAAGADSRGADNKAAAGSEGAVDADSQDADSKAAAPTRRTTPWGAGAFVGVLAFYPSVDQTISREAKAASAPLSVTHGSISPGMYALFDQSYYTAALPPSARAGALFSPGRAADGALTRAYPHRLAVWTCEYDQLLPEAEAFRTRLARVGKRVSGYSVEKVPHGFDKMPTDRKRAGVLAARMWDDAARVLAEMLAE